MKLNRVESNNNYQFKNLAKAFYDTFKGNKAELVQDMLEHIVFEDKEELVQRSSYSYYNYFKGRDISSVTSKIVTFIDKDRFGAWLAELLLSDDSNELLYDNMINNGFNNITVKNIVDEITKIFVQIIKDSVSSKNTKLELKPMDVSSIRVEDVYNCDLSIINKEYVKPFNNVLKASKELANSCFREEYGESVANNYELAPSLLDNEIKYYIKPKFDNSIPVSITMKFDLENCTEEEKNNVLHFVNVFKNLDYNNKPIAFPPVLEVKKSIDSKVIPNDLFEFDETKGKLFMLPNASLPKYSFTYKIFNKDIMVEIKDLELVLIHQEDCSIFTNNNRNNKEKYVLDVIANNFKEESMNINYSLRVKPEYANDVEVACEFFKIGKLMEDKTASIRIICTTNNIPFIKLDNIGKKEYSDLEKDKIIKFISYFDKLKYIQDYYNVKFNLDLDYMEKNLPAIEIVYASITNEDTFVFSNSMSFTLYYKGEEIEKFKPGDYLTFESRIDNINLFEQNLELKNTLIRVSKAKIVEVDKKNDKILLSIDSINVSKEK